LSEIRLGIKTKELHVRVKGREKEGKKQNFREGSDKEENNWSEQKQKMATEEWEKGTGKVHIHRWR
jgi:hypothetical protein